MVNQNRNVVSTIKSKLVAAVAMLLVGVFMVISSSYAWFTLSTAPEVTGIYTSVGANGNLEMALVPSSGALTDIETGVNKSGNNNAWGNLVDLSQGYGLEKIQLLPSRLSVTLTNGKYQVTGLLAPKYGADGRIEGELSDVSQGYYVESKYPATDTRNGKITNNSWVVGSEGGVTALGTASGMSAQQTAWNQYKRKANEALAAAQNIAAATFKSYGTPLANVVMTRAMKGEGATFDLYFVENMLDMFIGSENAAGVDDKLEEAAKWYFAAKAAEALYNDDDNWNTFVTALEADQIDVMTLTANGTETMSVTVNGEPMTIRYNANLVNFVEKCKSIENTLADAKDAYETAETNTELEAATEIETNKEGETVSTKEKLNANWTTTSNILIATGFLNYNAITVNGKTTEEIKNMMGGTSLGSGDIPEELVNFGMAFAQNGSVEFNSGSGVHADIADLTGEYQEEISVHLTVNGSSFKNDYVKLRTKVGEGKRIDLYGALTEQPKDNDNSDTVKYITDFYGYQLDFAFRTNAQGSNLMLQTEAAGRIYETNGSEATQGHGSTMTFAFGDDPSFTVDQAKNLMSAIRIVFIDEGNNIVGLGLLAQGTKQTDGTVVFAEGSHTVSNNKEITSKIYLYDYTIDTNGVLVVGDKKMVGTGTEAKADNTLMSLGQNEATKLSVIVYLDGDIVDNSMVAAGSSSSLVGSLNLQFSSSADLVPMDYAGLQGGGETTTETEAATEAPAGN